MRQRLRTTRDEASVKDSIRVLRGMVEWILWQLRNTSSSVSVSNTFIDEGGAVFVPTVETLPPIPTDPEVFQQVFWTSFGDGTGDDQVWFTYTGKTRWYPTTYTVLNGTPGV